MLRVLRIFQKFETQSRRIITTGSWGKSIDPSATRVYLSLACRWQRANPRGGLSHHVDHRGLTRRGNWVSNCSLDIKPSSSSSSLLFFFRSSWTRHPWKLRPVRILFMSLFADGRDPPDKWGMGPSWKRASGRLRAWLRGVVERQTA